MLSQSFQERKKQGRKELFPIESSKLLFTRVRLSLTGVSSLINSVAKTQTGLLPTWHNPNMCITTKC